MRLLGLLISYLSRICARVGGLAYEIATFLTTSYRRYCLRMNSQD